MSGGQSRRSEGELFYKPTGDWISVAIPGTPGDYRSGIFNGRKIGYHDSPYDLNEPSGSFEDGDSIDLGILATLGTPFFQSDYVGAGRERATILADVPIVRSVSPEGLSLVGTSRRGFRFTALLSSDGRKLRRLTIEGNLPGLLSRREVVVLRWTLLRGRFVPVETVIRTLEGAGEKPLPFVGIRREERTVLTNLKPGQIEPYRLPENLFLFESDSAKGIARSWRVQNGKLVPSAIGPQRKSTFPPYPPYVVGVGVVAGISALGVLLRRRRIKGRIHAECSMDDRES
ncbi:MAG: hypothetical protein C4320_05040 [Armatimonadota bacterium]